MKLRRSNDCDVEKIMSIVRQAQNYFNQQGIEQWQNGYPNEEIINNDILDGNSYVLVDNDEIIATVMVSFNKEKSYEKIYNGNWLSNDDYAVIHRLAVQQCKKGLGISSIIFKKIEEMCFDKRIKSIKVDTHIENESMKRLLVKNRFSYCGVIYLDNNDKRVAYEKILK